MSTKLLADWPKPARKAVAFAPCIVRGSSPQREMMTVALFMEVWRIFTSGSPPPIVRIASVSGSVVA